MPVLWRIISHGTRIRAKPERSLYRVVFIFQIYMFCTECLIILEDNYCQVPKCVQWTAIGVYSALKRLGTVGYIVCLKTLRHPETSAFYLKRRRGNGSLFETDSLSLEHQREEDKSGMKGVSVLWRALSPVFPCWAGKVASWVGEFCFSWIFLFILICTLTGADVCVLVPSLLLSRVRQDCPVRVGVCFSEFGGEFCGVLWFRPWRCRGVFRLPEAIETLVFYVEEATHSQSCWRIKWECILPAWCIINFYEGPCLSHLLQCNELPQT